MGSVLVIIVEMFSKYPTQMVFVEDDDMIGVFAPNASIHSLDIGVLPWAPIRRHDYFDPFRFDALSKPISINTIAIP